MTSQHSMKYMVRMRYFDSISAELDDVANLRAQIAKTGLQLCRASQCFTSATIYYHLCKECSVFHSLDNN